MRFFSSPKIRVRGDPLHYEIITFWGLIVMMLYEFVQKFQRTLFPNLPYLLSRKSKQTKALFTHYYTWYSFHLQLLHLVSMYTLPSYSQDAKVLNKKFVMCNNGWIHNTLVCNERNFVKVNENWNASSKWIWFEGL